MGTVVLRFRVELVACYSIIQLMTDILRLYTSQLPGYKKDRGNVNRYTRKYGNLRKMGV